MSDGNSKRGQLILSKCGCAKSGNPQRPVQIWKGGRQEEKIDTEDK